MLALGGEGAAMGREPWGRLCLLAHLHTALALMPKPSAPGHQDAVELVFRNAHGNVSPGLHSLDGDGELPRRALALTDQEGSHVSALEEQLLRHVPRDPPRVPPARGTAQPHAPRATSPPRGTETPRGTPWERGPRRA